MSDSLRIGPAVITIDLSLAGNIPILVLAISHNGYWGKSDSLEGAIEHMRQAGFRGSATVAFKLLIGEQGHLDETSVSQYGDIFRHPQTKMIDLGRIKVPSKQQQKKKG